MKTKTMSKLFAASALALSASALQAAPVTQWDILVNMKWDTNPSTYNFVPGDEEWNPTSYSSLVSESEVIWGYNGYKHGKLYTDKKPIDYTQPYKNDNYTTSALVISNPGTQRLVANGAGATTNTITFWNNFLDEDFIVPQYLQLNVSLDLSPVGGPSVYTVEDSFQVYYERFNVKYKKNGKVDIDHGTGYVIIPGDIAYSFSSAGYDYTLTFDIAGATLSNDCGASGFATCYLVGENTKKGVANVSYINFDAKITSVQSAVPEPETYAMLLAGLGLIGGIISRRRSAK